MRARSVVGMCDDCLKLCLKLIQDGDESAVRVCSKDHRWFHVDPPSTVERGVRCEHREVDIEHRHDDDDAFQVPSLGLHPLKLQAHRHPDNT